MTMQNERPRATGLPRTRGATTSLLQRTRNATTSLAAPAGGDPLATALGVFSVGLGLAELTAPEAMARLTGMPDESDTHALLRTAGLREIASGVGILSNTQPAALLWGRVAGDVMDLMLLAGAARAPGSRPERLAVSAAAVLGVTVLDLLSWRKQRNSRGDGQGRARHARALLAADSESSQPLEHERGVHVKTSLTVNKPREEVYRFWRQLENLPRFMSHLKQVEVTGERTSHWVAKAPLGLSVEWDAQIIEDRPGELLSWQSLDGASVPNQGSVRFVKAAGGRGTEVHVQLQYEAPGGVVGSTFAKLFGEEPGMQVRGDLRRFKQVMETGEVLHSDASVHAGPHPAAPSEKPLQREGLLLGSQLKGATR